MVCGLLPLFESVQRRPALSIIGKADDEGGPLSPAVSGEAYGRDVPVAAGPGAGVARIGGNGQRESGRRQLPEPAPWPAIAPPPGDTAISVAARAVLGRRLSSGGDDGQLVLCGELV